MRIDAASRMPVRLMTIGQLARKSGLTPRAIRYYEQLGLVQPPLRTESNYRLFDSDSVERLYFISKCRSLGFSMAEITVLLSVMDDAAHPCAPVKVLAERHLKLVDAKLMNLMEIRVTLGKYLSRCNSGKVPDCPVLEFLKKSA